MFAGVIVNPDGTISGTDGSDQGTTVGRDHHPFLRSRSGGELFRCAIGEVLAPDVRVGALKIDVVCETGLGKGGDIDPFAVRGPGAAGARLCGRSDVKRGDIILSGGVEGHHTAGTEVSPTIHLHNENPLAVRGEIGMMGHAAVVWRNIDVAAVATAGIGGNNGHVQALLDFRKEQMFAAVDPGEGRGVGQEYVGFAAQDRNFHSDPRRDSSVDNAGAIRGEYRPKFHGMVMSELNGLAVRKEFYVDVAGSKERIVAANEGEHAAVRRKGGIDGGIGEEGKLLPILSCGRSSGSTVIAQEQCCGAQNQDRRGAYIE